MEWISVKDRLPEREILVIVYSPLLGQEVGWSNNEYWVPKSRNHDLYPTHWMPLPEPPKAVPRKRWDYIFQPDGSWYGIYKQGEGGIDHYTKAEQLCNALNGTAQELLEFAGIKCKCESDPYKPYGYSQDDSANYRIVEGIYGTIISPQIVCKMLNRCCCKRQEDEADCEATKSGKV